MLTKQPHHVLFFLFELNRNKLIKQTCSLKCAIIKTLKALISLSQVVDLEWPGDEKLFNQRTAGISAMVTDFTLYLPVIM